MRVTLAVTPHRDHLGHHSSHNEWVPNIALCLSDSSTWASKDFLPGQDHASVFWTFCPSSPTLRSTNLDVPALQKYTYTEGRAFHQQNVWCCWKIQIINWRLGVKDWTAVCHTCSQVAQSWYTWKGLGKYLLNTESIKSSHLPGSSERSPWAGLLTQLLIFKSVLLWFLPGAKPNESLKERNCEVGCRLKWRLQEMGGKATKHSTSLCSPHLTHLSL